MNKIKENPKITNFQEKYGLYVDILPWNSAPTKKAKYFLELTRKKKETNLMCPLLGVKRFREDKFAGKFWIEKS